MIGKDGANDWQRQEYQRYDFDPAIVDRAMGKKVEHLTESEWSELTSCVRDCVGKTTTKIVGDYRLRMMLLRETEDIAQGILLTLATKPNRYDASKAPKSFVPRCWGFMTMFARARILNRISYYRCQKRSWHQDTDVEPSVGIPEPERIDNPDQAIGAILETMDELCQDGCLCKRSKDRAAEAIEELEYLKKVSIPPPLNSEKLGI